MSLPSPELHSDWKSWASALVQSLDNSTVEEVELPAFAKAKLPPPARAKWRMVYVTDEAGGGVPAFSDGTDWRRVTDRAVVS